MSKNNKRKRNTTMSGSIKRLKIVVYPNSKICQKYIQIQRQNKKNDVNKGLWNKFNTYKKIKKRPLLKNEWISPSSIRYSLMNDTCAEWIKMYYKKSEPNNRISFPSNSSDLNRGCEFENNVLQEIKNKYSREFVYVAEKVFPSINLMEKTIEYMNKGKSFIAQAVLYNFINKTFGTADLLVRSDKINKLFDAEILSKEEICIPSVLNKKYHYRVIDIKYSTLQLCSDGKKIRNKNNISYYKGQLCIYNAALGVMQGYTPDTAYLLCKAYKYVTKGNVFNSYDCFDRLGEIKFDKFDNKHIQNTFDCIKWGRLLKYDGASWICNPPSNNKLYPNMKNTYDQPYHNIKKKIAEELKDLTTIWYVSPKNRDFAHQQNILYRDNTNLTSEVLKINGERGRVIDELLETNNHSKLLVRPKYIDTLDDDWNVPTELDFYVDIETFNESDMLSINIHNSKSITNIIFCIGVGYEEDGKWKYEKFCIEKFDPSEPDYLKNEYNIVDEFFNFIVERIDLFCERNKRYNVFDCVPRFFHWSHIEPNVFHSVNARHKFAWDTIVNVTKWIDLYKIFVSEPITVKGSYNFSLKHIARAFYDNGLITTKWSNTIIDGYQAMNEVIKYYNFMNKYNKMSKKDKKTNLKQYKYYIDLFDEIIKYNEVDCKVLWEIVTYLRNNHC